MSIFGYYLSIFEIVGYGYLCGVFASFIFFFFLAWNWNGSHANVVSYFLGVTLDLQPFWVFLLCISLLALGWLPFILVLLCVEVLTR